jgi:hypothetical protein
VLLALTGRELDGTRVARQHAAKGGAGRSTQSHEAVPQEPPQPDPVAADETPQGTTQRTDRG